MRAVIRVPIIFTAMQMSAKCRLPFSELLLLGSLFQLVIRWVSVRLRPRSWTTLPIEEAHSGGKL